MELSAARTPAVDARLRGYARKLAAGPDLVRTLHAYYRHDMNRVAAAAALNVHPGSTMGVRALSAAVARTLADGGG
ncbi:helix-turn-helix domain-containing protein [Dactylosporangium sp. CA-233914]|uniref:helix-turn-helix domain-containing protein n=1 Tax=Dactylosporangium sp. CA-233914 TaxID=3239934 RepID=UPI003D8F083E